jgi:hypothetical protein
MTIVESTWHPLAPPDHVPIAWDGPHVGKRLIEALRTLRLLPVPAGITSRSNAWPQYRYEWVDLLSQLTADEQAQEAEHAARNWTRLVPSPIEIARMDQAIAWPARYLAEFPQLLRTVQMVAHQRARFRSLHKAAHRLRMPLRMVRAWNRDGLDRIAVGLIVDRVRVF